MAWRRHLSSSSSPRYMMQALWLSKATARGGCRAYRTRASSFCLLHASQCKLCTILEYVLGFVSFTATIGLGLLVSPSLTARRENWTKRSATSMKLMTWMGTTECLTIHRKKWARQASASATNSGIGAVACAQICQASVFEMITASGSVTLSTRLLGSRSG